MVVSGDKIGVSDEYPFILTHFDLC